MLKPQKRLYLKGNDGGRDHLKRVVCLSFSNNRYLSCSFDGAERGHREREQDKAIRRNNHGDTGVRGRARTKEKIIRMEGNKGKMLQMWD